MTEIYVGLRVRMTLGEAPWFDKGQIGVVIKAGAEWADIRFPHLPERDISCQRFEFEPLDPLELLADVQDR